jgi:ParB-like chromosome segregation protein Spo0J
MQIETFKTENLIEYARNPRKNDAVVDRMVSCIKEFGFKIPIVAKSDGFVIDGHLRLKAAKQLGLKAVPVVIADDLTETQIKAFRLIANQSANWAEWDEELLKLELEDLKDLDFDIYLTVFDLSVVERLLITEQ